MRVTFVERSQVLAGAETARGVERCEGEPPSVPCQTSSSAPTRPMNCRATALCR